MFDGGPLTSNYKNVFGWGYHAKGELLCQSGMKSGVVCNLKTGSNLPDFNVECWAPDSDGDCDYHLKGLIRAIQMDGHDAARPGDSGGPVFSLMGSGVRAKGIVSGGAGSELLFQDWADVIQQFNAYPVTPP